MSAATIKSALNRAEVFTPNAAGLWPVLDLSILRAMAEPPPFPLEVLGPWADWTVQAADGAGAPVDYTAGALLAVSSAIIGNARWASPWSSWKEPPVLWIGNVGGPSSGKSPAADPVLELCRDLEAEQAGDFVNTLARHERDKQAATVAREQWEGAVAKAVKDGAPIPDRPPEAVEPIEPVRPRIRISDATTEKVAELLAGIPRGLLQHRDELAAWFGNFDRYGGAGGDRAFYLESYGGRSHVIDRKRQRDPIRIPHLSLGVLGAIQPDRLSSILLSGDDDGLPARFIWIWPDAMPPRRPRLVADHRAALNAVRRLLNLQMGTTEHGEPCPVIVPFAADASDLIDEFRREMAQVTASGMYGSFIGKLPGMAMRIALVLEFLHWSWGWEDAGPVPQEITKRSVALAAHLLDEYARPMAERAYGSAAAPQVDRDAETIARWILRTSATVINARQVGREQGMSHLRDRDRLSAALGLLEEAGWIKAAVRDEGARGRSRGDYQVNPECREVGR